MTAHRLPRVAGLLLALTLLAFFGLHTGDAFAAGGGLGDFLRVNMAPVMFAALVVFLLLGYPVAFALAANGLLFALIGIELGLFQENFLQALPERVRQMMLTRTDKQVFLRIDGRLNVQHQMDVFDELKAGGVRDVGIVTEAPKQ